MNKIFLDKLCEFTHTTYKNYDQFNNKDKDFNIDEQIQIIKQNFSLNEKGISNKYNYIDLSILIPNIEFDQLVLLQPIAYNIKENYEWNYLLNALLIVLNDDYVFKTSMIKKKTLETFDKTFKKKIVIENNLDEKIIDKISKLVNVTLIILSSKEKNIYNNNKTNDKVVILFKNNNEYYPIVNWSQKYFSSSDLFVKYILDFEIKKISGKENNLEMDLEMDLEDELIKPKKVKKSSLTKVKSNITIDEDKNTFNTIGKDKDKDNNDSSSDYKKNNEFYEEVLTEANGALFISEAVDNKDSIISSTSKKNDEIKKSKTKKNSKDIFVPNNDKKINQDKNEVIKDSKENKEKKGKKTKILEEDSVFKKTEVLDKKELDEIKNNIQKNISLADLQNYANKLSINIAKVSEKTGKPKTKTKQELTDEIKEYLTNI
jgi:hypothetical protein